MRITYDNVDGDGDDEDEVENFAEDDVENDNVAEAEVEEDNVAEKCRAQSRGPKFVWACAVETHIDMSQEPFIRTFTGTMPQPRVSTLIKHPPLLLP